MDIPAELIAAFPPSANLLLNRICSHIDDTMLRDIARADHGWKADEMLAALRPIRDTGMVTTPMPGQLVEVLELTRWCNPDRPYSPPFDPGPTGLLGHHSRLFACAVLLRAAAEPKTRYSDAADDSTLAISLASAKVLPDEMSEAIGCFLTWRPSLPGSPGQPLLFALALLILAIRLRSGRFTDRALENIAEWVIAEEAFYRQAFPANPANPMPLAFSLQQGFWQPLAEELKNEAAAIQADDVRNPLLLCGLLLETDWS